MKKEKKGSKLIDPFSKHIYEITIINLSMLGHCKDYGFSFRMKRTHFYYNCQKLIT